MPELESRVAYLEGQVTEQSNTFIALREMIGGVGQRVDRLEQRVDRLEQRMDLRFDAVDRRFAAVDQRFVALDDKMSRQFQWIIGVQITTLAATIAAMLGAILSHG